VRVQAWDAVFVRARRIDVHPLVHHIPRQPLWWPGLRVRRDRGGFHVSHRPPGPLRRRQHLFVRVVRDRPGSRGLHLACSGDFTGTIEWYYLDEADGTVVHHLLEADTADQGWRRRLAAQRASVRAGLHALKDILERGRAPGTEPDPALLAWQQQAAEALRPPGGDAER
jgi:hypothetical protein